MTVTHPPRDLLTAARGAAKVMADRLLAIERLRADCRAAIRPGLRRQLTALLADASTIDACVVARRNQWSIKLRLHVEVPEEVLAKARAEREAQMEQAALDRVERQKEHMGADARLELARATREEQVQIGLALLAEDRAAAEKAPAVAEGEIVDPAGSQGP